MNFCFIFSLIGKFLSNFSFVFLCKQNFVGIIICVQIDRRSNVGFILKARVKLIPPTKSKRLSKLIKDCSHHHPLISRPKLTHQWLSTSFSNYKKTLLSITSFSMTPLCTFTSTTFIVVDLHYFLDNNLHISQIASVRFWNSVVLRSISPLLASTLTLILSISLIVFILAFSDQTIPFASHWMLSSHFHIFFFLYSSSTYSPLIWPHHFYIEWCVIVMALLSNKSNNFVSTSRSYQSKENHFTTNLTELGKL